MDIIKEMKNEGILVERKFNIRKMIDSISDFEIEKIIAKMLIKDFGETDLESIKSYLEDIINYGATNGSVNMCIYYNDINKIFNKYIEEINEYYDDFVLSYGDCIHNIFGIEGDPLLLEDQNRAKLLCGIVENIANKMYEYINENF